MLCRIALCSLMTTLLIAPVDGEARKSKRKRTMRSIKHIVLDAGHGGDNMGTPGAHGVHEKYLTLPITLELERLLKERTNAKVTLTRRDDTFVGLRERTRLANAADADVFLSIHCNASPNKAARGLEVYFLSAESATKEIARLVEEENEGDTPPAAAPGPPSDTPPNGLDQLLREAQMFKAHEQSQRLAEIILNRLHRGLRAPRRGVFQAPFGVLKEAEMPAVVVEVGFSSHAVEGKKLTTSRYQKQIARALFDALVALDRQ